MKLRDLIALRHAAAERIAAVGGTVVAGLEDLRGGAAREVRTAVDTTQTSQELRMKDRTRGERGDALRSVAEARL